MIGRRVADLFGSSHAVEVLHRGRPLYHVVERARFVVDYVPVRSEAKGIGLLCTFTEVGAIQDAELVARTQLAARGFVAKYTLDDVIGESRGMQLARDRAARYATAEGPVLITGRERGQGKKSSPTASTR